jgi:hypothetical protein
MSGCRRCPTSPVGRVALLIVGVLLCTFDAAAQFSAPPFAMVPVGSASGAVPVAAPQGAIRIDRTSAVRCDCADRDVDFTISRRLSSSRVTVR